MSTNEPACISGWLKNSFIDYPGTVATVLFFSGCNLRCAYCHNPDIVRGCLPPVAWDVILDFLKQRKGMIEGVVLSGGEPTIHGDALLYSTRQIRALGYKVKLDTNGLRPEMIARLAPDYCALDIKALPQRYAELGYGGTDAVAALAESLAIVRSMHHRAEVRITVATPFIDTAAIEALPGLLAGIATVYLQSCKFTGHHLDNEIARHCPADNKTVASLQKKLAAVTGTCTIRGS